ncbi:MAG: hypothetical protein ACRCXB_07615 [Aeromonadaceae bacterium]
MIVDRLLAYFGVDVDEKSFKDAQGELQELEGQMMGIITAAGAMGAAIGAAAFAMVTDFANTADATNKLARRIGTTAETLQEYDYVAERSGVTTDLMRNSLEKLQGKVSDAANGNKDMTATLKELGLEAKAFAAMPLGDQMEAIAKGFQGLKSDGDRTRLAMKLFEEEGRGMVTVFEGGADAIAKMRAEARGFGVYSTEDAAMAEEFNDRLLDAKMSLGAIQKLVSIELLPVITEMLVTFRDFFLENKEWIKSGIVVAFNSLTFAVKGLAAAFAMLALNRIGAGIMFATTAIRTMTAAMTTARIAALALAASQLVMAFAIPAAIGAAAAAIVLVFEDIISYFRGDKSITGLIVDEMASAWEKVASTAKRIWGQMIDDMKSMFKDLLPEWAIEIFAGVDQTNAGFEFSGFGGAGGNAAMATGWSGGSVWDKMPVPQSSGQPVQVQVTTNLNGTTIDQVNQSVATNARMANAATYRDTRKGVDY